MRTRSRNYALARLNDLTREIAILTSGQQPEIAILVRELKKVEQMIPKLSALGAKNKTLIRITRPLGIARTSATGRRMVSQLRKINKILVAFYAREIKKVAYQEEEA